MSVADPKVRQAHATMGNSIAPMQYVAKTSFTDRHL